MNPLIDTAGFPVGQNIDYESEEEVAALATLEQAARDYVKAFKWAPPIKEMVLAFGVAPLLGLFLARFERGIPGAGNGDTEVWAVVGDLPSIYCETDEAPTPATALRLYCAIAQDWADSVLAGADLSDSYPILVPTTRENAEMLLSRIEFIREKLIPLAA